MILNKISQAILLSGVVFLSACSEQAPSSTEATGVELAQKSAAQAGPDLINIDNIFSLSNITWIYNKFNK